MATRIVRLLARPGTGCGRDGDLFDMPGVCARRASETMTMFPRFLPEERGRSARGGETRKRRADRVDARRGPRAEGLRVGLGAVAAAGVDPVALDQEVAAAEAHVGERAVGDMVGRAEGPGALVGVLLAPGVVPGVEVGVGRRLLQLVGDDRRHAVGAGVAVRRGGLLLARARAAVGVANEGVLDVLAADRRVRVPAAVLGAEA